MNFISLQGKEVQKKRSPQVEGGLENHLSWTFGIGSIVGDHFTLNPHFSLRKLKPREVK